jgi:hypothetical protein
MAQYLYLGKEAVDLISKRLATVDNDVGCLIVFGGCG